MRDKPDNGGGRVIVLLEVGVGVVGEIGKWGLEKPKV